MKTVRNQRALLAGALLIPAVAFQAAATDWAPAAGASVSAVRTLKSAVQDPDRVRGVPNSNGASFSREQSEFSVELEVYTTDARGKTVPLASPFALLEQDVMGRDGGYTEEFSFPALRIDWNGKAVLLGDETIGALVPDRRYPGRDFRVELRGYELRYELTPQSDEGDGPFEYGSVFLEKAARP